MVVGPCTPYVSSEQVATKLGIAPDTTTEALALEVSETVYVLLGRQFPGICTATVRPVRTQPIIVGMPNFVGRGAIWGGGIYGPSYFSPPFGGMWCAQPVELNAYIRSIDAVVIDGVALADDEWYLDGTNLHRVGKEWPNGQKLQLPDTEVGTWSITYTFGPDNPAFLTRCCLDLAEWLWLIDGATDADCGYPQGTTTVTRQGVTTNINDRVQQAREAGPVIPSLNSAAGTWNPGNRRAPSDLFVHHKTFRLVVQAMETGS